MSDIKVSWIIYWCIFWLCGIAPEIFTAKIFLSLLNKFVKFVRNGVFVFYDLGLSILTMLGTIKSIFVYMQIWSAATTESQARTVARGEDGMMGLREDIWKTLCVKEPSIKDIHKIREFLTSFPHVHHCQPFPHPLWMSASCGHAWTQWPGDQIKRCLCSQYMLKVDLFLTEKFRAYKILRSWLHQMDCD